MKKNRSKSNPNVFHNNYFSLKTNNLSSIIAPNRINSVNFLKFQPKIKITKKNLNNLSSSIINDDYNNNNHFTHFRINRNDKLFDKKLYSRNRMNKTSSNLNRLLLNLKNEIVEISQSILNEKNTNSNFDLSDSTFNDDVYKPKFHFKSNSNNINYMNFNNNIKKRYISLKYSNESSFKNSYIPFNKRINQSNVFHNSKELSINDLKDEKINTLINENDLLERKLKMSNGLLPELIEKASKYEKMYDDLKKETLKKSIPKEKENYNYLNESRIENLEKDINEVLGNDKEIKKSIHNILKNNYSTNQNEIKILNQEDFETFKYQNTENGASNKLKIFEISKSNFNVISEKGISYHKDILNSQCEIIELRKKINDLNEKYKNEIQNLKNEKHIIELEKEKFEKNVLELNNKNFTFNNENNIKNEQIEELKKEIEELKKEIERLKSEKEKYIKIETLYEKLNNEIKIKNEEFKLKETQFKEKISKLENKNNEKNTKKIDNKNYKIIKNGNLNFLNSKKENEEEKIKQYENIIKLKDEEIKNLKENIQGLINDLKEKNDDVNDYVKELDENDIETMKITMENLRELVSEKEKEIKYLKSITQSQNANSKQSNHNSQNKIKQYKIELENCKLQYQAEIEQNNLLKEEIKRLRNNENQ